MGIKKKIVMRLAWPLVSTGTAWLAGAATERVLGRGWKKVRGGKKRRKGGGSWGSSLAWTAASAAIVGVCGAIGEQAGDRAYARVTGKRSSRR